MGRLAGCWRAVNEGGGHLQAKTPGTLHCAAEIRKIITYIYICVQRRGRCRTAAGAAARQRAYSASRSTRLCCYAAYNK